MLFAHKFLTTQKEAFLEIINAKAAAVAEKIVLIKISITCIGLKMDIQPKLSNKMLQNVKRWCQVLLLSGIHQHLT